MKQYDAQIRFADLIIESEGRIDTFDPKLSLGAFGVFETFYAPFEHVNTKARVTIIGLTPGQAQMRIALEEMRLALKDGLPWHQAIERAKYSASFGGPMRANLIRMLDHIGLNAWLGIGSCASLFSEHQAMAHHTSVLRYPVFKNGTNYSGQPPIEQIPFLQSQVDRWFRQELAQLPESIFIPLGAQAQSVLKEMIARGDILEKRCLIGMPHPSGANAERIAYFLGRKKKDDLSRQTDGTAIDLIRDILVSKVQALSR